MINATSKLGINVKRFVMKRTNYNMSLFSVNGLLKPVSSILIGKKNFVIWPIKNVNSPVL
jgi:hypothetical protein